MHKPDSDKKKKWDAKSSLGLWNTLDHQII